jgi:general secretion pathway protein C
MHAGAERRLNHNRRMAPRITAFVIWALVAAAATFWGLRLGMASPTPPPHAVAEGNASLAGADFARLLGSGAVEQAPVEVMAVAESVRFRLAGVMAPKATQPASYGVALIAVDGKPARAYRVGGRVDGEWVLQTVALRSASIGPPQGPPVVVLELPALPQPATGTLPPAEIPPPQ